VGAALLKETPSYPPIGDIMTFLGSKKFVLGKDQMSSSLCPEMSSRVRGATMLSAASEKRVRERKKASGEDKSLTGAEQAEQELQIIEAREARRKERNKFVSNRSTKHQSEAWVPDKADKRYLTGYLQTYYADGQFEVKAKLRERWKPPANRELCKIHQQGVGIGHLEDHDVLARLQSSHRVFGTKFDFLVQPVSATGPDFKMEQACIGDTYQQIRQEREKELLERAREVEMWGNGDVHPCKNGFADAKKTRKGLRAGKRKGGMPKKKALSKREFEAQLPPRLRRAKAKVQALLDEDSSVGNTQAHLTRVIAAGLATVLKKPNGNKGASTVPTNHRELFKASAGWGPELVALSDSLAWHNPDL
jgi:hypothetical protein